MTHPHLRLVNGGVTEERSEFTSVASLHASRQRLLVWLRSLQQGERGLAEPDLAEVGFTQIPEAA